MILPVEQRGMLLSIQNIAYKIVNIIASFSQMFSFKPFSYARTYSTRNELIPFQF